MHKKIKVIVVDDSALMRQMISDALNSDPEIEVVDTAADPLIAREKIKKHNPDVLTLDVEMPRMSGLDFLSKIMSLRPMPVVMISTLTQDGADTTLKALSLGAVDFVGKPLGLVSDGMARLRDEIIAKVKCAAKSKVQTQARSGQGPRSLAASPMLDRVIAIGASTGGIPCLSAIVDPLPSNAPPVLITQHMPASFTGRLAARMNELCEVNVLEARDGLEAKPGHVYIAPGGKQMRLKRQGGRRILSVTEEDKVNGFCPSVDVLFDSVAECEGEQAIGIILTGMGQDGARGLLKMRQAGAITLGQDESSSLVYGMPRVAFEMGGVMKQYPLSRIPDEVMKLCRKNLATTG